MKKDLSPKISDEEFEEAISEWFGTLDKDKDGYLDPNEDSSVPWLAHADRNGDGKVDIMEFMAAAEELFDRNDKNHDHGLSESEFKNIQFASEAAK
jgi:hypothetical protein